MTKTKKSQSARGRRSVGPRKPQALTGAAAHREWLSVTDTEGAFLALPPLVSVWPTGMPTVLREVRGPLMSARSRFEKAWDEWDRLCSKDPGVWSAALETPRGSWSEVASCSVDEAGESPAGDDSLPYETRSVAEMRAVQHAWLQVLFEEGFGWDLDDERVFGSCREVEAPSGVWEVSSPDDVVVSSPDFVMHADGVAGLPVVIVDVIPAGGSAGGSSGVAGLRAPGADGWAASPVSRMEQLLVKSGCSVGLVTDGRHFALVYSDAAGLPASGVWDCFAWSAESSALAALIALMQRSQVVGGREEERLPQLFELSKTQAEMITESLGTQVRQAVELLVAALSQSQAAARKHFEAQDQVLPDSLLPAPDQTYLASVTSMMRVVFLLFAGERGLLPQGKAFADSYGLLGVFDELQKRETVEGPEALDTTFFTWYRLLATSQVLYGGARFGREKVPAYGGDLFDPVKFPELTVVDSSGVLAAPVSDRVMLSVLKAVQVAQVKTEARRVSFQQIDVEQIGYIYEGLLGYTAKPADEVILGLVGAAGKEPEVPLAVLEDLALKHGADTGALAAGVIGWLKEHKPGAKPQTKAALKKLLEADVQSAEVQREVTSVQLRGAVDGDRLRRWMPLVRKDLRGLPIVYFEGDVLVTETTARKDAGAHYTPKALAEEVVRHALEPVVYSPGPHQTADSSLWRLKSSDEILELKVADIACGSGAFLVAAARYLADKLLEAQRAEGLVSVSAAGGNSEARRLSALRSVVAHCLYGADIDPLAAEMCKLSLWLVSLDPTQPFSFVDDKVLVGNSVMGVTDAKQLRHVHIRPDAEVSQQTVLAIEGRRDGGFAQQGPNVDAILERAARLRRTLASEVRSDDPMQSRAAKHQQLERFRRETDDLRTIADGIVACALIAAMPKEWRERTPDIDGQLFDNLRLAVAKAFPEQGQPDPAELERFIYVGLSVTSTSREEIAWRPLHWAVELPDVMEQGGFDAIIGNPPFLGGQKLSGALGGEVRNFMIEHVASGTKGSADLVAYFVLQACGLLRKGGSLGLIATNTLAQGDTREVGLDQIVAGGFTITRAIQSRSWPSKSANLEYAAVWGIKGQIGDDAQAYCEDEHVRAISTLLEPAGRVTGLPQQLDENSGVAYIGCYVLGMGFVLEPEEARDWIEADPSNRDVLFPYMNGKDLNSRPDCSPSRWVIDFYDRSEKAASAFELPWERVRSEVHDERQKVNRKALRERWWQYAEKRPGMRRAIEALDEVLVIALVSSAVMPMRVPTGTVFSHMLGVSATDRFADQAVLSSSLHRDWAIQYGSSMRKDVRYTPSDVFDTFPRPEPTPQLEQVGEELHTVRQEIMLRRELGLTKLYNLVNDPTGSKRDRDVRTMRDLHKRLDETVAAAYGWCDLDLGHGFHTYRQVTRWTVSPAARVELMDRLLEENHRRHAEETKGNN